MRILFSQNNDLLQTGFTGTSILGDTLTQIGLSSLSYKLLFNEQFPSWLYAVKMGATTIWERWDSIHPNGEITASMSSLNHYSYGSIVEWIWRYAAGLNQSANSVGFQTVSFQPHLNSKLRHANATYHSASGKWHISWEILDNWHVRLQLTVPFNCQANIQIPFILPDTIIKSTNKIFADYHDHTCWLTAGTYDLTYETNQALLSQLSTNSTIGELMADSTAAAKITKLMPSIRQVPEALSDQPLRSFMLQYGAVAGINEQILDDLDQQLRQLK